MKKEEIIPKNDKWKISKGVVYKKMLVWMPLMNLNNKDYIEIYFDIKFVKDILKIIPKIDEEFYLISPIFSDIKNKHLSDEEIHRINIKNYLSNYANSRFHLGFQKIEFDVITNLIKYCKKFDCMLLIKESYDEVNKSVQSKGYDWYLKRDVYDSPIEIREDFGGLYRQIKLAELLN